MPPRLIFADTFYWLALLNPRDAFHARAQALSLALASVGFATTDEVLTEVLDGVTGSGPSWRRQGVQSARYLLADPSVEVIPQDRAGFLDALDFYEHRLDKGYSLTDCRSMRVMYSRGITEVLTNDHHFTQEGFTVLFP
jgi:predicted nucleic acid-binding protein